MELKKATRKTVKLRLGLSGASGFGKTYSALLLANGMGYDWDKIAVIDSENGSSELYTNLGTFNVIKLIAPFTPERYIEAIKMCESAGIEVIIIDSISHEWEGNGGCLDIHMQLGGQFVNWAKVTPRHNNFIRGILDSKCHVITTVRRKQDFDMVKNDNGKTVPVKVGLKEVTREGFEYELTLNLELINDNHLCKASKDRTGMFDKQPEFVITKETGKKIIEWCLNGIDELKLACDKMNDCTSLEAGQAIWSENQPLQKEQAFQDAKEAMKTKLTK